MSELFGALHTGGAPIDPSLIRRLEAAMGAGRVGWRTATHVEGALCMGRCVPESADASPGPLRHPDGRAVAVAQARLDDRMELLADLGRDAVGEGAPDDGDLVLAAWRRWGEACVEHLHGDWALAAWDPGSGVFLARDRVGAGALHYTEVGDVLIWAGRHAALLALAEVDDRLDDLVIAASFLLVDAPPGRTVHRGVRCLWPGHTARGSRRGWTATTYWRPERIAERRDLTRDDSRELVGAALERAVAAALRGTDRVELLLSSGLDSAAILACAASVLGEALPDRLRALTARPLAGVALAPALRQHDDEAPVAAEMAAFAGIEHEASDFSQVSPVCAVQRMVDAQLAVDVRWVNGPWIVGAMDHASERGCGALLDGWGGNLTASWAGLVSSQPLSSAAGLRGTWRILRARTSRRLKIPGVPAAALRSTHRRKLAAITPIGRDLFERSRIAERFAEDPPAAYVVTRMLGATQVARFGHDGGRAAVVPMAQKIVMRQAAHGRAWNLRRPSPLADARLIEAVLSVPDRHFATYDGGRFRGRSLFRDLLRGRVPASVLGASTRGVQGRDIGARLRRHRAEFLEVLARGRAVDPEGQWLDHDRLHAHWRLVDEHEGETDAVRVQGLLNAAAIVHLLSGRAAGRGR